MVEKHREVEGVSCWIEGSVQVEGMGGRSVMRLGGTSVLVFASTPAM